MVEEWVDPIMQRAMAEAALERASGELRTILHLLVHALDPFPPFLEMSTIQAVEIDTSGVADPQRGCIVVCPDGELYELVLRMIPGPDLTGSVDQMEEMKELDLPPGDYVAYASTAIRQLASILEQRQRGAGPP